MTVNITFISIWDGETRATSSAQLNTLTGEITNIGPNDLSEYEQNSIKNLDEQIVVYNDCIYTVLENHNGFDYAIDLAENSPSKKKNKNNSHLLSCH